MILGIDFGTCYSSIAIMNGSMPITGYFEKLEYEGLGVPTLFMYDQAKGKEMFGKDCLTASATMNSAAVVRNMKKIIRQNPDNPNVQIKSGGKSYSVYEVVKKYLTHLISKAEEIAKTNDEITVKKIEGITITAPVGISSGQMTATDYNRLLINTLSDIAAIPKSKVHLLQEPVAAAISYLYGEDMKRRYNKNQTVLVFDLGGGTLDVTVVEHDPTTKEYVVKAKEGDLNLGGNDWDDALCESVLEKTGVAGEFATTEEMLAFRREMLKLKHQLTDVEDAMPIFKYKGRPRFCEYTRWEFERASEHLLNRAIEVTKRAISSGTKWGVSEIDKIILVGGSCNMPQIRERMLREFSELGSARIITHDPSKAIAKGAAVYAEMIKRGEFSHNEDNEGPGGLKNLVSHTYGFDSQRSSDKRNMIYNVLYKNTPYEGSIKAISESSFVAIKDSQDHLSFTVYESDCIENVGDEDNWMDYGSGEKENGMKVTVYIPETHLGKATTWPVWVSFALDSNEVLEIIITDINGKRVGYDKKQI